MGIPAKPNAESGMVPNTLGAWRRWHLDCGRRVRLRQGKTGPEPSGGRLPLAEKGAGAVVPAQRSESRLTGLINTTPYLGCSGRHFYETQTPTFLEVCGNCLVPGLLRRSSVGRSLRFHPAPNEAQSTSTESRCLPRWLGSARPGQDFRVVSRCRPVWRRCWRAEEPFRDRRLESEPRVE